MRIYTDRRSNITPSSIYPPLRKMVSKNPKKNT